GHAEHIADALVGHGALALQTGVIGGFRGESVQVEAGARHQKLASLSRARKSGNGVVKLKQDRVGEAADVLEAAFGACALQIGGMGLPACGHDGANQRDADQYGGKNAGAMPMNELAGAVAKRIRARSYGMAVDVAPQIGGELFDGTVAAFGLLAERHEQDVVEVAGQLTPETVRTRAPRFGHGFGRSRS